MLNLIHSIILYIKFFLIKGKGTYIRMITDKYEDVFIENNQVGVICKKELLHGEPHITIDFDIRFLVCAREDYIIIPKEEYLKDNKYISQSVDLTHLIEEGLKSDDDIFAKRRKKQANKKLDKKKQKWYTKLVIFVKSLFKKGRSGKRR